MIKESELRIGNWVVNNENKPYPEQIEIGHFHSLEIYEDFFEKDLSPIVLTSEMVEKFGFKKDKDGIYVFKRCLYWLEEGILQIALNYSPLFNAPCKYVHQLQNLIFALTGEELKINFNGNT